MKSFYSILYVPLRASAKEQVSVGLLLSDGENVFFSYSTRKLEVIKKLLPRSSYNLLQSYLFGLKESVSNDSLAVREKLRSDKLLSYLADYANSLLTFSSPSKIDVESTEEIFNRLFQKFVFTAEFAEASPTVAPPSLESIVRKDLYPRIKDRVNIDESLTAADVPSLLVPSVKVNFIGQNEFPVVGQVVDFVKNVNTVTSAIGILISLIKTFELDQSRGQYYVIGGEPDKEQFGQQHSSWEHLRSSGIVTLVDPQETDQIVEYIDTHNVRPFKG